MSHTSLPGADSDQDQYDGHAPDPDKEYYDNIYETEHLPPLGICKALYAFEGKMWYKIHMLKWERHNIYCYKIWRL